MENGSSNVTLDPVHNGSVRFGPLYLTFFSLIDIVPLLVGQPAVAKLLWVTLTSKKAAAILYINVALFLNLQYWIAIAHFIAMLLRSEVQLHVQTFLFVYAQIGGPMSLTFVCVERYVAVMHPTCYPQLKKYRLREIFSAATWSFSVTVALLRLQNLSSVSESMLEHLPFYCLTAMIVIMVHHSVRIVWALKKCGPRGDTMHPAKKKAFRTVCATLYVVLLCYAPVTAVQRLGYTEPVYSYVVVPVSLLLLSVASVVHPLHYLSTQGKIFTCLKREKKAG